MPFVEISKQQFKSEPIPTRGCDTRCCWKDKQSKIGTKLKVCESFDKAISEKKEKISKQKRRDSMLHMEAIHLAIPRRVSQ